MTSDTPGAFGGNTAERVEVEVVIDSHGEVTMKVKGVKGKGCVDVTKAFEEAVGELKERKLDAAYYEPAVVQQSNTKR